MTKKKKLEGYAAALDCEFERWDHIYKNGCSDPSWPDGVKKAAFVCRGKRKRRSTWSWFITIFCITSA
jgi:hypothetical protein